MFSSLVRVAVAATAVLSVTEAAALPSRSVLAPRQVQGYTYDACYTEATGIRALSANSYYDDA
jgi:hypothetical protein